jgi:hypothetical protein
MAKIEAKDMRLIIKLCKREVSKDEFMKETSFEADVKQLEYLLEWTKNQTNEDSYNPYFEAIFWRLPEHLSEADWANLHRIYLLKNWHNEHENMAMDFQTIYNNDKENISTLVKAITQVPKYLKEVDPYPYIRKLIYAIGAQPSPYNIVALEELASSTDDEEIRKLTLHQIDKRKEFGRWEAKEKL